MRIAVVAAQVSLLASFLGFFSVSNWQFIDNGHAAANVARPAIDHPQNRGRIDGCAGNESHMTEMNHRSVSAERESAATGSAKGGVKPDEHPWLIEAGAMPLSIMQSLDMHVVFYTFIALAIVWILLFIQNRRFQLQANEMRERVSLLSSELQQTRDTFNNEIHEYRNMLRTARDGEERYRSMFANNVTGVYLIAENGAILDCNEAFARLVGCESRESVFSLNAVEFYESPADRLKFLEEVRRSGTLAAKEFRLKRRDGGTVWVLESVRLVNGNLFGTIADITERKTVEEQARQYTEKLKRLNADKDKFFSIISHDLRSPLSVLHGYTELLHAESRKLDPEAITLIAGSMHALTVRINVLLENLLDWSRLQAGQMSHEPTRIEMETIAQGAVDLLKEGAEKKQLTVRRRIDKDAVAKADKRMIASVMQNLVSNAIKFSRNGGRIDITASREDDTLLVSVADTGIGMTVKQLDSLFRIDVTNSTPGTADETGSGLGLVLCKELIELNGGRLSVESTAGAGSTFSFTLPVWNENGHK